MKWLWGVYVAALILSIWVGAVWPFLLAGGLHIAAAVLNRRDKTWQQRTRVHIAYASRLSAYTDAIDEHEKAVGHLSGELGVLGEIVDDHQASWRETFGLDLPAVRMCECGRDAELRDLDALLTRVGQDHAEGRAIHTEMADTVATLTNSWADQKKRLLENAQRGTDIGTLAVAAVEGRDREEWERAEHAMAAWKDTGIQDATGGGAFRDASDAYDRARTWVTNRLVPTVELVYPCRECIRRVAEAADREQRELIAQAQLEQQQQIAEQQLAEQRQLMDQQERLAEQRTEQQQFLLREIGELRKVQERRARQKR